MIAAKEAEKERLRLEKIALKEAARIKAENDKKEKDRIAAEK